MSRTPCNYCTYQWLKDEYKNKKIVVTDDPLDFAPKGKKVTVDDKFMMWFMELPDKCEC